MNGVLYPLFQKILQAVIHSEISRFDRICIALTLILIVGMIQTSLN